MLDWKRQIFVTVAGQTLNRQKIEIEIKREASETPATGTIIIYNLSRDTEQQIFERGESIIISAGYGDRTNIIFDGAVQRVEKEHDITQRTRTTSITLAGANVAVNKLSGVSTIGFSGSRPLRSVVSLLVADLDLILGPLDAIPDIEVSDYSFSGQTAKALTTLLAGRGVHWYEQDGTIRFNSSALHQQSDGNLITLSPETGLIGSPSITDDGVATRSTLKPQAKIGDPLYLTSDTITGAWKIVSLLHKGDNWQGDFFTELSLKPVYDQATLNQLNALPQGF